MCLIGRILNYKSVSDLSIMISLHLPILLVIVKLKLAKGKSFDVDFYRTTAKNSLFYFILSTIIYLSWIFGNDYYWDETKIKIRTDLGNI